MKFHKEGHLGGYVVADDAYPHGDPKTYTPAVWDDLVGRYGVGSVVDVGCGEGHAADHFLGLGLHAVGVDGCDTGPAGVLPAECRVVHDYSKGPAPLAGPFDLAWSCEFVEHVEERHAENFLKTFDLARVVAMTHAFPGQAGHHHVNCREPHYWVSLMEARGFRLDGEASLRSRLLAPDSHWARSGLIFVKERP